jgi:uncharacterized protein
MNITWKMYDEMLNKLYRRIHDKNYDIIIGVTRGGLVPAVHLSHLLGLPMGTVQYQLRDGDGSMHIVAKEKFKNALIVDDICDTGATLKGLGAIFKTTDFAVLIDKTGDSMVKHRAEYFESDQWVIFPWEQ